jgi:hypothetical protein
MRSSVPKRGESGRTTPKSAEKSLKYATHEKVGAGILIFRG